MDLDDDGRITINWKWVAQMLGSAVLGAVVLGGWIHKVDAHVGSNEIHKGDEKRRQFVMNIFKDSIKPTLDAQHNAVLLAIDELRDDIKTNGRQ